MKAKFILLFLLATTFVFSQQLKTTEKRVEIDLKDGRYNEQSQLFDFEGYELGDLVVADNSGDDIVLLGEGNDLVIAGDGADRVEGGGGINSISYEFSDEAVDVDRSDLKKNQMMRLLKFSSFSLHFQH